MVAVILVYGMSIVLLIASHIKKRTDKREQDKQISRYIDDFQIVRERHARDSYKNLKRSIIAKINWDKNTRSKDMTYSTIQKSLMPIIAIGMPGMGHPPEQGAQSLSDSLSNVDLAAAEQYMIAKDKARIQGGRRSSKDLTAAYFAAARRVVRNQSAQNIAKIFRGRRASLDQGITGAIATQLVRKPGERRLSLDHSAPELSHSIKSGDAGSSNPPQHRNVKILSAVRSLTNSPSIILEHPRPLIVPTLKVSTHSPASSQSSIGDRKVTFKPISEDSGLVNDYSGQDGGSATFPQGSGGNSPVTGKNICPSNLSPAHAELKAQHRKMQPVWIDNNMEMSPASTSPSAFSRLHPTCYTPESSSLLPRYTSSPRVSPRGSPHTSRNTTGSQNSSHFLSPPSPVLYNNDREELIQVTCL